MAIYGPQDAMRHEHRDQLQELVVVRGFDDQFDRHFYVKTMRADLRAPKGSKSTPGQLFLESAKAQQRVADAGSHNWVTVHLAGTGPRGPYVVLDYYPRSANEFVENKVPLSGRSLYRIVSGTVDGLIDLQRISDRPHGNLKPSNVLIGPGELERTEVALADPAPLEQLATQGRGDAYDLGQLIHCLVLQRRFTGSWPIEPSAGWTSLGSKARGWRELCNRLLNPNPDKRPRLRQIRADLAKLQPNGSAVPRVAIGAALATFVLAAGAALYVYDPLDLRRPQGGTQAVVSPSPIPGPVAVPGEGPLIPQQAPQLAVGSTPEVTTPADVTAEVSSPGAKGAARPAVQLPEAPVAQVRTAQQSFASRGWSGAAGYLQELSARVNDSTAPVQAADVSALESAAALAGQVERDWAAVSQTRDTLADVDDRIVRSYGAAVERATEAGKADRSDESLRKLADSLSGLANDADWAKVVAFVKSPRFKELDLIHFTQASEAYRNFGDKSVASAEDLAAWLRDAESGRYNKLDPSEDPRRAWAAAERLRQLYGTELPRLARPGTPNGEDPQAAALRKQLQSVEADIASLQTANVPWDRRNDEGIRAGVREIDEALARLEKELKQAIAQRESDAAMASARAKETAESARRQAAVKAFVDQLSSTQVSAVPLIEEEWQAHVRSVSAALQKDPAQLSEAIRAGASDMQRRLREVDVAQRMLAAPAAPRADMPQWAQALVERVNAAADVRREGLLAEALAAARAQPSADKWQAHLKRLVDEYSRWREESRTLLADVADLQLLLAAGYMPDEKPDAKSPTPREVLARIEEHPLWEDQRVRAAVEPLVQPVAAAESKDWQALLKAAATETVPLGVRLAAWEQLASDVNPPWPADQEDLAQNLRVVEALQGAVKEHVLDDDRLSQLSARVQQSGRRHWERFLTRASSQPDIELALRLKDRYLGSDVTSLDRRSQFNVLLHDLRPLLVEAEKDPSKQPSLREQVKRIEQAIATLPAEFGGHPNLPALAGAIRGYGAATGASIDVSRLGPMSARGNDGRTIRWTFSYDAQTQTLTCVAELPRELTHDPPEIVFKRIEGDEGTPAFFLSTTEVSVGLFGDMVHAAGRVKEFERLLGGPEARGRDQRVGPRSWYWHPWRSGAIFRHTVTWLTGEAPHYATQLRDSQNGTVLRDELRRRAPQLNPSNRHPMQYVSPGAAMAFASLVGCRLQTPQEWDLANRTFPSRQPNLRDQTWRMQYQWAADARANRYLPDRGIFVPTGEVPSRDVWTEAQWAGRGRSAADRAYNDGVLFFHEVAPNGGQSFNHLVGNVAEYAFTGDRMYVVGASALSPPAPVRAVEQAYEVTNWRDASNEGYSDVGFRLAFDAPPAPVDQLRTVVEKQPYLTPASPTTRPIAASE